MRGSLANRLAKLLLALGLLLYVSAKVHFFASYGAPNYLEEHSVFWLGMIVVAGGLFAVERIGGRGGRR
jgi:hypothetical protein